jgi:hypothetical protein
MQLEIDGVTYFAERFMPEKIYPSRRDMWKWRLWWRFFGYKRPGPYTNVYIITDPFTGRKMGMVPPGMFERLKAEVAARGS